MTSDQLYTVLNWKYPDIGKAYSVQDGELVFQLWLDRSTGLPSQEPKPTYAQCEAWLPDLPGPDLAASSAKEYDEAYKCIKALALVCLDEINTLRQSANLTARTEVQMRTAFINKRKVL